MLGLAEMRGTQEQHLQLCEKLKAVMVGVGAIEVRALHKVRRPPCD
jgi:hypothetical protein